MAACLAPPPLFLLLLACLFVREFRQGPSCKRIPLSRIGDKSTYLSLISLSNKKKLLPASNTSHKEQGEIPVHEVVIQYTNRDNYIRVGRPAGHSY